MEPSTDPLRALGTFRDSFYDECLHRRADALFELTHALLSAGGRVPSPAHLLSLQPSHRRGWGSLYAALRRGRIEGEALRGLLTPYPLVGGGGEEAPVYAVDVSVWPRCDPESRAPSEATITTLRATRLLSRSGPVGLTSSSPGSTSSARAGPPPWTWSA
jgi:hypothetical protein